MSNDNRMSLSIWFLCGIILSVFGLTVAISGIYNAYNPPPVFGEKLHLDIIWGFVLLAVGITFIVLQRPSKIRAKHAAEDSSQQGQGPDGPA